MGLKTSCLKYAEWSLGFVELLVIFTNEGFDIEGGEDGLMGPKVGMYECCNCQNSCKFIIMCRKIPLGGNGITNYIFLLCRRAGGYGKTVIVVESIE